MTQLLGERSFSSFSKYTYHVPDCVKQPLLSSENKTHTGLVWKKEEAVPSQPQARSPYDKQQLSVNG